MISIIMPNFNGEKFIRKSIESIINQSMKDFELIIIDDGSTDSSITIIENYLTEDNKILLIKKENGGVSSARNIGLKFAKGDYVLFVDSDDEICEGALAKIKQYCDLYKPDIIIHPTSRIFENSNDVVPFNKAIFETDFFIDTEMQKKQFIYPAFINSKYNIGCISSWIINREIIRGLFFDESFIIYEDLKFFFEVSKKSNKILSINYPFYLYRLNKRSAVNSFNYKKLDDLKRSNEFIIDFFKSVHVPLEENYILKRTYSSLISNYLLVIKNKKLRKDYIKYINMDVFFSEVLNFGKKEKLYYYNFFSNNKLIRIFYTFAYNLKKIIFKNK